MSKQHLVSLCIAAALFSALQASPAQAADVADITIARDGTAHALSVDLDVLGDGQTLQLSTKAGVPAIVRRAGDTLTIDLAGASHEVKVGQVFGGHWVGEGDGERAVEIIRLGDGDSVHTEHEGSKVKIVRLEGDDHEVVEHAGEHRVMVFKRDHEGALDEAEIAELIEQAKAQAGATPDADGTQITVERRITRDAVE